MAKPSYSRGIGNGHSDKLHTLPNFIRAEPSPKIMDSAFPPFKTEHRYRGVYERAGFDVNLGGSKSDTRSIRSKRTISPTSYGFQESHQINQNQPHQASQIHQPHQNHQIHQPYEKLTRKKPTPIETYQDLPYPQQGPQNTSRSFSESSQPNTSRSTDLFASESPPSSPGSPDKLVSSHDSFNFSPPPTNYKNHKNLQLDLAETKNYGENENYQLNLQTQPGPASIHSFESEEDLKLNSTKDTSVSRVSSVRTQEILDTQEVQLPAESKRLSSLLQDFKNDVADHKKYQPKSPPPEMYQPRSPPPVLPSSSPSQLGLSRFEPPEHSIMYPSSDYEQFQNQQVDQLNPDQSQYNRQSHLSTMSSIISKESFDDEDDEIERELARQLENLKTNGNKKESIMASPLPNQNYTLPSFNIETPDQIEEEPEISEELEDTHFTSIQNSVQDSSTPQIPSFTFQDESKISPETDSDFDDLLSHVSFESVKSLSVRRSRIRLFNEDDVENLKNIDTNKTVMFNDVVEYSQRDSPEQYSPEKPKFTPETPQLNSDYIDTESPLTKPLSPKTHKVEEELSSLNFKIQQLSPASEPESPTFEEVQPLQPKSIDAILAENQPRGSFQPFPKHLSQSPKYVGQETFKRPTSTFQPFPKSDSESPEIEASLVFKKLPGQGPCRFCHDDIFATKGSRKPIYSKTGELSGQWHRSCFLCAYNGCSVQFSKNVQCYAFKDNAYCNQHYHELNNTVCNKCNSGIEGECIENELSQKWHLNCLKCGKCSGAITNDYYLINGDIFCENDAVKVINGIESYSDVNGNLKKGGLTTSDKIEKRRTRVLFVE